MKKRLLAAVVAGAVMLSAGAQVQDMAALEGYQLQQVLIMSRHNLRASLANNGSMLEQSIAKAWPQWDVPGSQLTTKGGALEVYMGHYMREWLAQQRLVTSSECPPENMAYAYANSLQRTVATARFFITGAFPDCDTAVHHQPQMGTMDPTFNPVITDDPPTFREKALQAMEKERQGMQPAESYKLLETMIDYRSSPSCREKQVYSPSEGKDTFSAGYQQEPGVPGPLKVGNLLVDAFTLQYYGGFPKDQVAWGEITSDKQRQVLSKLKSGYQDSLFTSVAVAQNVTKSLVKYIDNVLVGEGANKAKVTLLVGHDSNITSLLTTLDFKPYQLPGQYERTPIGGKLLFRRWHDSAGNRDLMKIEYVYRSTEQLRNTDTLTLQTPPQRVTLVFNGYPVDGQGFCPLETSKKVINEAAK